MNLRLLIEVGAVAGLCSAAFAGSLNPLPAAPVKPVIETLWGQRVTDNYRYMEQLGPETTGWMRAESDYTRRVLDSIRPRAALAQRAVAFDSSMADFSGYVRAGEREFYEERAPTSDNFDLMIRDAQGTRKLVDVSAIRAAHGGKPYAINYFLASPDGSKVAVGISEGGSEDANLSVFDVATGHDIAGPIDRARFGVSAWSSDSRKLFFLRMKHLVAGEPQTDKERYVSAQVWDLKSAPVALVGNDAGTVKLSPDEQPCVFLFRDSSIAILASFNGVQNELKLWWAPAKLASDPKAPWKLVADRDAGVTYVAAKGGELYLLSHKNAPTYQILDLKAGQPLATARVVVPADPSRVIEGFAVAADGLYAVATHECYSALIRVPYGSSRVEKIPLPVRGHIFAGEQNQYNSVPDIFADPQSPGVAFNISSWVVPPAEYRYDSRIGRSTDLRLVPKPAINPADYTLSELEAKAHDGTMVPLTLLERKDGARPQITYIRAYGAYGLSIMADFSLGAFIVKEGIARAVCHVRGGGEKGEAWHLAGKDANKHNSWEDLIACSEDLIARGVTTKNKLFIEGESAGGITVGRALTERPDLFAGAIDMVPLANPLRSEFSPNGPPNIPEFGTVKTKQGFRNLYAMDSVAHVRSGIRYPSVLIATGLNDPRVAPWMPAKFTAALQASRSPKPVLLRIDEEAGHGVGSTEKQSLELVSDAIAFMFWRAGKPEWQPTAGRLSGIEHTRAP